MSTPPRVVPSSDNQRVPNARELYQYRNSGPNHVIPKDRPPRWTVRSNDLPDRIHRPSNTIVQFGSSTDLARAAMPPPPTLEEIGIEDIYRADWEVKWGIVAEKNVGDWALVKWVTSSNPIYSADEIVELAGDILDFREEDYGEQDNDEALMMRILWTILEVYETTDRVRATLEHGGVRNRILSIVEGQDTLEWMGYEDEDVGDEGFVEGDNEHGDQNEKTKDCLGLPSSASNNPVGIQGAHDSDTPMYDAPT